MKFKYLTHDDEDNGYFIVVSGFNDKECLSIDKFNYTNDKKKVAIFTRKRDAEWYARNKDYIRGINKKDVITDNIKELK